MASNASFDYEKIVCKWECSLKQVKALAQGDVESLKFPKFNSDSETSWEVSLLKDRFGYGGKIFINLLLLSSLPKTASVSFKVFKKSKKVLNESEDEKNFKQIKAGDYGLGHSYICDSSDVNFDRYEQKNYLEVICTLKVINKQSINQDSIVQKSGLASDFGSLLETQEFADVEFKIEDKVYKAHRIVLAARSKYFDAMFSGNFAEGNRSRIEINEVEPETFEDILKYIYSNEVEFGTSAEILKVMQSADKYLLGDLVTLCEDEICRRIKIGYGISNILDCLILADSLSRTKFKDEVLIYIGVNYIDIQEDEQWEEFKQNNSKLAMEVLESIISVNGD